MNVYMYSTWAPNHKAHLQKHTGRDETSFGSLSFSLFLPLSLSLSFLSSFLSLSLSFFFSLLPPSLWITPPYITHTRCPTGLCHPVDIGWLRLVWGGYD